MNSRTAFTVKSRKGLLHVLVTEVDIRISNSKNAIKAIWDTGATGSAITQNVISALSLTPTGKVDVLTANGLAVQNKYIVDILLPSKVLIKNVTATGVDALGRGCDALIGMDIITLGDFSVTNYNGDTCMSFRCPSCHEIDYVKDLKMDASDK